MLLAVIPTVLVESSVFQLDASLGPDSWILKALLWNFSVVTWLVEIGILPFCRNCELMSWLNVLFYAFFVGVLGYGLMIALIIAVIRRYRPAA